MALPRKVKRVAWIVLLAAVLVLWISSMIYRSSTELVVTAYEIPSELTSSIRIVHLSDLHSAEYGEDNSELIALVEAQDPDMIFMTGDMLNRDGSEAEALQLCELVSRLVQIAPLYWSDGNHERVFMHAYEASLHDQLTRAGAVVLDGRFLDVTVNDQEIRIGGYYGYYRTPHMITNDPVEQAEQRAFFEDFENTHRVKLLLCHIPTAFTDWGYLDRYPVDVVFAGHYHGGIVRLPMVNRGLYAPYVGWFPPYTKGAYAGGKGVCVLSAGLGSEYPVPRLNNPPEIVVADLIPTDTE